MLTVHVQVCVTMCAEGLVGAYPFQVPHLQRFQFSDDCALCSEVLIRCSSVVYCLLYFHQQVWITVVASRDKGPIQCIVLTTIGFVVLYVCNAMQ